LAKHISIWLILIVSAYQLAAQKIEKDLLNKTWYCSCNFNSDSLILSADNMNQPVCEVRFSPTGKLYLKNLKKRTSDSSFTYLLKNKSLTLRVDLKDSVKIIEYEAKKLPVKKAYELRTKFSSRYVRKKGDDTVAVDKFTLAQEKKRKTIEKEEEIAVFSQKRALHNDSINRAVWGQFVGYVSDTLLIDSDQFVEHNFYKKYTDTLHYIAPLLFDTMVRIKVPTRDITGIYCQREPMSTITTNATLLAFAAGFACVAASLIIKDNLTSSTFAKAGVVAFLTIPISFSTGLIFSKQKFQMKPGNKNKKIWTIERRLPGVMVTQGNKIQRSKKQKRG
jgi:hypothetical protein